jgi:uncharacterized protein YbaP (TraB family)
MKTITLLTLLMLGLTAHAQTAQPENYRLLWEITGGKSAQPSYLFGTMHVTDSRVFGMPDSVLIAIQNSPGFALEIDFDVAGYQMLEYMYSQHGSDIFDESHWSSKAKSWDGGGEAPKADPSDLFKLLDREGDQSTEATFLDAFLYRVARENGKTITGLEGIIEQLALLTGDDLTPAPAPEPGAQPRTSKRLRLSEMISVYEKGDLDRIDEMVNKGGTSQFFKEEVIIRRNHGMAERADSLMHIRPTFFGVGAAHLPGKEGVIALLREAGYKLRPVVATYSGLNRKLLDKPYEPQWTNFKREGDGYQIKVPTKPFGMDILDGKLKMYLGMDFPGGIVYCFYAMSLPEDLLESKMDDIGKAMIKGFGSHGIDEDATKDIEYKSLKGKEYVVRKSGESLRIRTLFGNGKMYMLLLGNNEKVIFSEAADQWFDSFEIFEPVKLTRQTPHPKTDNVNGFSLEFPGEPDFLTFNSESFTTGGQNTPYSYYELKDLANRQRMVMLTEDFEDWYAVGDLESRMPDCILYYSSAELEPVGEFKNVVTDGVRGLEGTYLGSSGLKYRIRCYLRLNRLYLLGMTLPAEDEDSAVVDRVFESLHFLRTAQPQLKTLVNEEGQYVASFPGKPTTIERLMVPSVLFGKVDSIESQFFHDPVSSLNTQVTAYKIWRFYSGTDQQVLEGAAESAEKKDAKIVHEGPLENAVWNAKELVLMSNDSTMLDHRRWFVAGDYLLEGRIHTTNDAPGKATAAEFFQQFQPRVTPPTTGKTKDLHHSPKLAQIFALQAEGDGDTANFIFGNFMALGLYALLPEEYPLVLDSIRKSLDTIPYNLDDQLLNLLVKTDDSQLLPDLQKLYEFLPETSSHRMRIVGSLLERTWPGANEWALARLHDSPNPLSYSDQTFQWRDYLTDDSTFERLRAVEFLLDKPEFALQLAADMVEASDRDGVDYSAYDAKFVQILDDAIEAFGDRQKDDWRLEFDLQTLIQYLADHEKPQWEAMAHRLIRLDAEYLPGAMFVLLADHGIRPSSKECKIILDSRYSRESAIFWVLDNERLDILPAKYRKHEFIAEVALDYALEEYPDQVELVEKRRVFFLGESQWLYVYKFAFEGEADWTLGFSGPFPLDGDPADSYFDLSGSNWEEFHPNSYVKKTKAWVKEMEEYAQEEE